MRLIDPSLQSKLKSLYLGVIPNLVCSSFTNEKGARRGAEDKNPEDFIDPETPSVDKKRMSRQMAKQYSPTTTEKSFYPPLNVTGALHIGHALTAAIEEHTKLGFNPPPNIGISISIGVRGTQNRASTRKNARFCDSASIFRSDCVLRVAGSRFALNQPAKTRNRWNRGFPTRLRFRWRKFNLGPNFIPISTQFKSSL
ncbi:hypothetical protein PIB30_017386 [Stylosanthes scabra]|uniref:Valyl-tRNA synthetase n=1 Tax=Stylosanthes scabra TaxID=79078 RepID=A0ABU6V5T8_9FABA|nr:hypothetical protein [Stylosanthes scabra]